MASSLYAEWKVIRTQPSGMRQLFFNDLSEKQKRKLATELAALGEELPPELEGFEQESADGGRWKFW